MSVSIEKSGVLNEDSVFLSKKKEKEKSGVWFWNNFFKVGETSGLHLAADCFNQDPEMKVPLVSRGVMPWAPRSWSMVHICSLLHQRTTNAPLLHHHTAL
jgi:hypothetical protein